MARPVPADLEDALASAPAARDRFWALPPDQKDAWVGYVERARLPSARRRRVAETVRRVNGGRAVTQVNGAGPVLPREGWAVWLFGLALLAAVAGFIVWWTVFRHHHHHSRPAAVVVTAKATVPKVTSIRVQSAEFQLREAKLGWTLQRRNSGKPKGIVLAQSPKNGKQVPQGTKVALVVSKGPAGVAMPDVVGLAAADAVRALHDRKLVPTIRQVVSQQAPGTVLAQQPQPGTRAKPGTKAVLDVAKPEPQATTTVATTTQSTPPTTTRQRQTTPTVTTTKPPATGNDYTGMHLADAVQKIADGRQQVTVTYVTSTVAAGTIVSNARSGSRERLQVSAGPQSKPSQPVPDVTGEDQSQAQQDLKAAGFSVVVVSWPVSDASSDGVVVAETPAGGGTAPQGAAVVIYVGSASGG